jgi:hypothetical protein
LDHLAEEAGAKSSVDGRRPEKLSVIEGVEGFQAEL